MPKNNAIQEFYNAAGIHPTTDPDNPKSKFAVERYESVLRRFITPGMRALDLGCNAGRFTFALEAMGALATGIDFAEVPLRHAKKVAAKRKSGCQFHLGDITALPYRANAFDAVLLPQNIGYLSYQDMENLAIELRQILSDAGVFIVTLHDELVKRAGEANLPTRYDVRTGVMKGKATLPQKGTYESPWYFWTVAFTCHIIERHLSLKYVEQVEANRFLLVFQNNGE